ncbi:hypothetical protein [Acanthopleuribacter pedis]|uniref:Uncharacterized protein n=1 Tax=Acanthopleuribacter pedis TaxID=442870 RepID=A0A8J7U4F1_9BACT|nr:hypothetical protein [Acanthopleuribacter pedis]MBO1320582.1 hypothetical protein [Acanthopleuribacter pedis]
MKTKFMILMSLFSAMLVAGEEVAKRATMVIDGTVVTGVNRAFGEPIWDLGEGFGTLGFETLGVYNPDGLEPLPLTSKTHCDNKLATYVDPVFLSLFGIEGDVVPDSELNRPLRGVGVIVDPAGQVAVPLPDIADAGMLDYSRAASNGDITIKKWQEASGMATLRCTDAGSSVDIKLKNLVPNGLYTVSAVFMSAQGPVAVPLGGVPNAVVTDENGDARYKRSLNFCYDDETNPARMLIIDITYHSNHSLYGTQTNLPFAGTFAGTINHIHMSFLVNGTELE